MTIWILIVYLSGSPNAFTMQEFDGLPACELAGSKVYELTGRNARWTCVKK